MDDRRISTRSDSDGFDAEAAPETVLLGEEGGLRCLPPARGELAVTSIAAPASGKQPRVKMPRMP